MWRTKVQSTVQREHELNAVCEHAMCCLIQRDTTLGTDAVFLLWLFSLSSIPDVRTAHSVARPEVDPRAGYDLSPGWMIRRLDANDFGFEGTVVLVHELEEFELRRGGPDDQNGINAVEFTCDVIEEPVRIIRMFSLVPTPFWMAVKMMLRREDCVFVCGLRMDVKDARFLVVEPDDCMRHDLILS